MESEAKNNTCDSPADSQRAEDQWAGRALSRLGERIAVLQVEEEQEAVSRREIAGIVVRHASQLVARAAVLPLAVTRAPPDRSTAMRAAATIGRFWRRHKPFDTFHLLQNFHEHGPTIERVKSIRWCVSL